jgi:hypothetical protein
MSDIYKNTFCTALPVLDIKERTYILYYASDLVYNTDHYRLPKYICTNSSMCGFIIDDIRSITVPILTFVVNDIGKNNVSSPCIKSIRSRKKGYISNLKRFNNSKFMHDTKYEKYLNKWKWVR